MAIGLSSGFLTPPGQLREGLPVLDNDLTRAPSPRENKQRIEEERIRRVIQDLNQLREYAKSLPLSKQRDDLIHKLDDVIANLSTNSLAALNLGQIISEVNAKVTEEVLNNPAEARQQLSIVTIAGEQIRLSAEGVERVITRCHIINLDNDAQVHRLVGTYIDAMDPPATQRVQEKLMTAALRSPDGRAAYASYAAVVDAHQTEAAIVNQNAEAGLEITQRLLKKYPAGPLHDKLTAINSFYLYNDPGVQAVLVKLDKEGPQAVSIPEIEAIMKPAWGKYKTFADSHDAGADAALSLDPRLRGIRHDMSPEERDGRREKIWVDPKLREATLQALYAYDRTGVLPQDPEMKKNIAVMRGQGAIKMEIAQDFLKDSIELMVKTHGVGLGAQDNRGITEVLRENGISGVRDYLVNNYRYSVLTDKEAALDDRAEIMANLLAKNPKYKNLPAAQMQRIAREVLVEYEEDSTQFDPNKIDQVAQVILTENKDLLNTMGKKMETGAHHYSLGINAMWNGDIDKSVREAQITARGWKNTMQKFGVDDWMGNGTSQSIAHVVGDGLEFLGVLGAGTAKDVRIGAQTATNIYHDVLAGDWKKAGKDYKQGALDTLATNGHVVEALVGKENVTTLEHKTGTARHLASAVIDDARNLNGTKLLQDGESILDAGRRNVVAAWSSWFGSPTPAAALSKPAPVKPQAAPAKPKSLTDEIAGEIKQTRENQYSALAMKEFGGADRHITAGEMAAILQAHGIKGDLAHAKFNGVAVDENHDGKINPNELVDLANRIAAYDATHHPGGQVKPASTPPKPPAPAPHRGK